jgi:hypothetical protein
VPFTELASGTAAKAVHQKNYVVMAKEDFSDIWAVTGAESPTPAVDFSKQNVIAVFAGREPSGGYAVKIDKITDTGSSRIVSITLTEPAKDCMTSEALTSPYEVVAVPASTLVPQKDVHVVTQKCD